MRANTRTVRSLLYTLRTREVDDRPIDNADIDEIEEVCNALDEKEEKLDEAVNNLAESARREERLLAENASLRDDLADANLKIAALEERNARTDDELAYAVGDHG